jgi:tRNA-2-methylthio-N6-dimethylallyladenosine synthase
VVEICLLGQNVNSYVDGNKHFPELLSEIANINGVERLTYMTSHPKDFSQSLVDVMKSHKNIMSYIHLPFQAGSERILKMMNRKYTPDDYLAKVDIARTIPNINLTTDILVGFPTESDDDFADTMRIVEDVRFNEAFMYRYNTRPGTAAEKYDEQVPEKIKLKRLNQLITTQNTITKEILKIHIGKTYTTLAESVSKKDVARLIGRTHNGVKVFFKASKEYIGKIVDVKIVGVSGIGLKGELEAPRV